MAVTLCTAMQAQTKTVTLHSSDLDEITINGPHYERPTINYDDKTVTISADTLIYDAMVVIKNANGNVIHQEQTVITPTMTVINLPQTEQAEKSEVEVFYDDKRLYGFFEKR